MNMNIIVNEKNACVLLRLQHRIHAAKQHNFLCVSVRIHYS